MASGTYVYCLVASAREPSLARVPAGLRGTGSVRLLDVSSGRAKRWLVVADAPLSKYGEGAIAKGLGNLDWVSRAAVAHERVVDAFLAAPAILPMKLFTIFSSDERARAYVASDQARIDRILKRVSGHHEWGVRVTLDRPRASVPAPPKTAPRRTAGGAGYLAHKKAQRDAVSELAKRARETVADLFEEVAPLASEARKRGAAELPAQDGPLLLDSMFLVRTAREAAFRRTVERRAKALAPGGYNVTLSGPWPPYGFIQD